MKRKILNSSFNCGSGPNPDMYIYDLPYSVMDDLCCHLDQLMIWPQIAKFMQLTPAHFQSIRFQESKGNSPFKEILNIWGIQYNHRIEELFAVFHEHELYEAMRIIKDYVRSALHPLIPPSKPKITDLLKRDPVDDTSRKIGNRSSTSSGVSNSNNNFDDDDTSTRSHNVTQNNSSSLKVENIQKYASSILEINYDELCLATNNWSDQNILGKGGFGTVYKGEWKCTDVAIKLMHYKKPNGTENISVQMQQSLNELKFLNSCRHDNILPLYGYSVKGEKPCLVYQLMLGGSLEDKVFGKHEPVSWQSRVKICLGTARGINYLHTFREKPLIHGDIKPANILLDVCLTPKIGDFGLAREGPNAINTAVEVTQVFGTKFYLPPEFLNGKKLSTKVDTFGFGIVLLETFSAQRAYNKLRQDKLNVHIRKLFQQPGYPLNGIIDPRVPMINNDEDICRQMIYIGLVCTSENPDERPEMVQVLQEIKNVCQRFAIDPLK